MKLNLFQISLEDEQSDGKSRTEMEYVIYAKVTNWDGLQKAIHKERQEQRNIRIEKTANNNGGSIRVRKVTTEQAVEHVLTIKTDIVSEEAIKSVKETTMPISADFFEQFKLLTNSGMNKTRYTFDIAGSDLKWEVDVFGTDEAPEQWVKIDLEVSAPLAQLPQLPPLEMTELITAQKDVQTPEEKQKITDLYSSVFTKIIL